MASTDITRVAGNIGAMEAYQAMDTVNKKVSIHQTRLATGKRLNAADDDPAGMNLAITFDVRRNDLKAAIAAIGDGKNMLSVAETGLRKIADVLNRMKSKVMEAAGSTVGAQERDAITTQLNSFAQEIDQIVESTNWNGLDLIGYSSSVVKHFFVGVSGSGGTVFADFSFSGAGSAGFYSESMGIKDGAGSSIYVEKDIDFVANSGSGVATLETIIKAIRTVKNGIVQVGSFGSRLTFKEDAMLQTHLNTEAAYNRIMNANMAEEQTEVSKNQILQQTSTAMLAQANSNPQVLMSLFR